MDTTALIIPPALPVTPALDFHNLPKGVKEIRDLSDPIVYRARVFCFNQYEISIIRFNQIVPFFSANELSELFEIAVFCPAGDYVPFADGQVVKPKCTAADASNIIRVVSEIVTI